MEVFLPSSDIWLPELSLYYSLNFNSAVKLLSNNDARVNYTGHVRWYLPFSTESLCSSVDVKFFPFDIQQCTLMFGSWAHSNDSIKFSLYSQNLSLIDFYDNQEWQLDMSRSHITAQAFLYDYLDPPLFWEMIIVELVVGRQSFYYVFNLVIPSGIIAVVAVVGFHTPSTSARVRDAKFRLGIMTLMSMSTIVVAIVEDMPKFSMSGSRKARGSFSGVPLIGLYYFMLLVIVGLSTMTTSMFVFLERDFRTKRRVPWYLRWLSYDIRRRTFSRAYNYGDTTVEPSTTEALLSSQSSTGPHRHLNGFVGEGTGPRTRGSQNAQGMAMSLLRLVPAENDHEQGRQVQAVIDETTEGYQHTISNPGAQEEPSPPLRRQLRKRLSLAHYDNMLLYQYFGQQIEDLSALIQRIERSVKDIKGDMVALLPQDDINSKWQTVIRRLELLSLSFYMSLLFTTAFLFFYHDWYCAIGNSPCGTPNHKCPWMKVEPCG
ncbi:unnamed protein product [Bursaphelenchus xylophilus]|uniref:(pine wood nematode) hypothetical protein n=1 Tax=Bursaphelenchus xylophilus TaxID=6326 RepID=A0A1I7RT58_BURXY|nr:unnamed protein product [Bursaphelenchus xylophilus]CAG9122594.1 unnamed protein product [Bursaphelenchus xylophilus]